MAQSCVVVAAGSDQTGRVSFSAAKAARTRLDPSDNWRNVPQNVLLIKQPGGRIPKVPVCPPAQQRKCGGWVRLARDKFSHLPNIFPSRASPNFLFFLLHLVLIFRSFYDNCTARPAISGKSFCNPSRFSPLFSFSLLLLFFPLVRVQGLSLVVRALSPLDFDD